MTEKEETNKKWHLIRTNNGEWISNEYAISFGRLLTDLYQRRAILCNLPLSKHIDNNGSVWFYKHDIEKIDAAMMLKASKSKGLIVKHRTKDVNKIIKNMEYKNAYYDRKMSAEIEKLLVGKFNWLIDYVYNHEELDFQTGSSWFSIYRGTGRILTLKTNGMIFADAKYMALNQDFYRSPTVEGFNVLLDKIKAEQSLSRYYIGADGEKKEGYYQTLIARRYTLFSQPEDDFIIFDKEFVIGYKDTETRDKWQAAAKEWVEEKIKSAKENHIPGEIKIPGSECDFVGITKEGDLLLMELKRHEDTSKIRLSPLQIGHYEELVSKFMENDYSAMNSSVMGMIKQKSRLGLISPLGNSFPSNLSGKIKLAVVVGGKASQTAIEGFRLMKQVVGKEITYYTCDESSGTLIKEVW